jgi:hypothetical protein
MSNKDEAITVTMKSWNIGEVPTKTDMEESTAEVQKDTEVMPDHMSGVVTKEDEMKLN